MSAANPIERQASDWLVRRAEGALPNSQEQEFQQWLAADARHVRAFQSLQAIWSEVGELEHLGALAPLESASKRRRWLPLAAAAAIAALVLGTLVAIRFYASPSITTQLAEVRKAALPDGSTVTLGARSTLAVQFDELVRRVILKDGQGFFEVASDASRPFEVQAGGTRIRVLGTEFDVRYGREAIQVAVAEGKVEVLASERRVLTAGERAEVRQGEIVPLPGVARAIDAARDATLRPEETSAWRFGRLVYDNGRLADLVDDVNRYYAPGVELASPDLGALRVTAAFRTDEIPPTLAAITRALPIAAEYRPDGRIVLRPRAAAE